MPTEMSEQRSTSVPAIELPSSSSSKPSKNTSPTRSSRKPSTIGQENGKDSESHPSPTKASNGNTTLPSSAAVQRALSVTKAGSINNDSSSDAARDRKHRSGQNTPQWPTSPRLKSPPPSTAFRSIVARMNDNESSTTNGAAKKNTAVSSTEAGVTAQTTQEVSKDTSVSQTPMRPPGRGVSAQASNLETVAENSDPSTPSLTAIPETKDTSKLQLPSLESTSDGAAELSTAKDNSKNGTHDTTPKAIADKADTAPSSRATSVSRPPTNLAKRSFTTLTGKGKLGVEPLRTITLETETVSSNPPLITDRGREGGSVRTKPSTETIRPKKEKKKPSRKAPSLHAGMNSSKADIFEAKVASAVGDADSSDSEETFVYESNPPDARQVRHHSRTPSANSLASQMDPHGARGKHGVRGGGSVIGGKKSMKFSNSLYGNQLDTESAGDGRSSTRTTSNTPKYHHIGRHGRNGHASIMDADSTFTQANRGTSPRTPTTRNSRPSSPRTSNGRLHFARKSNSSGYDAYEEAADDERAPLIGTVRTNRNRHSRRPNSSHLRTLHFVEDEDPGWWPRYRGCFLIGLIITLVVIGVSLFVVVINKGLEDVKILSIQNVLASEQELMVDLRVRAVNPNLFTITVTDLDVNLFAESPYVGTTAEWEARQQSRRMSISERRQNLGPVPRKSLFLPPPFWSGDSGWFGNDDDGDDDGDGDGDDPITPGSQKMLLGRIFEFDSPLIFAPSPLGHVSASSVGEIRLMKPGNKTESGGSARWNRVLGHNFTLIVRGVLQYQLPLSSSIRSAKIGSRISVTPSNSSSDGNDNSTTTFTLGL